MFDKKVFQERTHGEVEWKGRTLVIMQLPYPFLDTHYKAFAVDADEDNDEEFMIYWRVIDNNDPEGDTVDWEKFKVETI
jgi:hypothetical protein